MDTQGTNPLPASTSDAATPPPVPAPEQQAQPAEPAPMSIPMTAPPGDPSPAPSAAAAAMETPAVQNPPAEPKEPAAAAAPAPSAPPVPPVPPSGTAAPAATTPSGSHATLIVGTIAALALFGAAAGYYYWTTMKSTAVIVQPEVATTTVLVMNEATLRPMLEGIIGSMNTAVMAKNYDDFMKTMGKPEDEGGKIPTKEEFDQSIEMLQDFLIVDLTKTNFVKAAQDGDVAGYYYTTTEEANVAGTNKTQPMSYINMVKFVRDSTAWKIVKMYSTNIDDVTKAGEAIATNPKLSLSSAPVEQGVDAMLDIDGAALQFTMKLNGSVVENKETKNVWGGAGNMNVAVIPVNKYLKPGTTNTLEVTTTSAVTKSSSLTLTLKVDDNQLFQFELDTSKKTQSFTFTIPQGVTFKQQKSIFDGTFGN